MDTPAPPQPQLTPPPLADSATPRPWRDISLECVPWDTAMLDDMRRLPIDSPLENAQLLIEQVNRGQAHALKINCDGRCAGLLLYAIETHGDDRELNLISLVARANAPISAHIVQMLTDMAKISGCQSIRFSTVHEGLEAVMNLEGRGCGA